MATKQIGSLVWKHAAPIQIFGANTGVGKTVATTLLLKCGLLGRPHYIKPVSTGDAADEDSLHIRKFVPSVNYKTLVSFDIPVSPHLAARHSKIETPYTDNSILTALHDELVKLAALATPKSPIHPLVECAGGVLSPGPSGTLQADLYRPLRLPVLLVADHRLGGIGATISAWESLHLRGYDVVGLIVFQEQVFENYKYFRTYFKTRDVPVYVIPRTPPPTNSDKALDLFSMQRYYEQVVQHGGLLDFTRSLSKKLLARSDRIEHLADRTESNIWHPFLQHTERSRDSILVIDSAYGDYFQSPAPANTRIKTMSTLVPTFDGSASWWTQGLGHGNPDLALAAAHAAGRYGHVMFANASHEPAVELAERLIKGSGPGTKANKVFYTDNGSTGMEVAVKMALKAAARRYGWQPSDDIMVLGLKGSYHGDTIGVMDCSEGNVYNAKVEWYKGRGFWFDFPKVKMSQGKWKVIPPAGLDDVFGDVQEFDTLDDVFDRAKRTEAAEVYRGIIDQILKHLVSQGNKFGALIMEPVILGAGGMLFADPLFQHELWQATQRLDQGPVVQIDAERDGKLDWSGMPVVADEVFTGLYRLGHRSSSHLIGMSPDIVVYAKLLTGGLLPLAATVASKSIFNAFLSKDKADALLHGHSYTAHAMGCSVANKSLRTFGHLERSRWRVFQKRYRGHGTLDEIEETVPHLWSMWSPRFVSELSYRHDVEGVFAVGSVLAIEMKDAEGAGYTSTASIGLRDKLLLGHSNINQNVHCRVLGNVLYFMASLTTEVGTLMAVQCQITTALNGK
ncbi:PLP-dependent transferase [Myriangium duriaei CBS 260.36]|uniref:PLP-dependent transferase n=1 Tax=Myriangium duriaei CBS 260.36 TaxID=1168546 RepID=A0A9P4J9Y8_9PEZI|nr:PLP-dependent transferase [Myriangium duriaei CBS 260.36]